MWGSKFRLLGAGLALVLAGCSWQPTPVASGKTNTPAVGVAIVLTTSNPAQWSAGLSVKLPNPVDALSSASLKKLARAGVKVSAVDRTKVFLPNSPAGFEHGVSSPYTDAAAVLANAGGLFKVIP